MKNILLYKIIVVGLLLTGMENRRGFSLPSPRDIPEEMLRNEIITEGRSEVNGKILNSLEYSEIHENMLKSPYHYEVNSKLRHLVFLLKIRKMLKTFVPVL